MATSDEEMLDLINAVITKRLNGDGYEEYSHREQRFKGMTLKDLFAIRDDLKSSIEGDGTRVSTIEFFEDC